MQNLQGTQFEVLFDLLPDAVVLIDTKTQLPVKFNTVAHTQLGYTKEEFALLTISDYEALEDPKTTQKHIQTIVQTGRDDFDTKHKTKNNTILDIRVTVVLHIVNEHPYFLCTFRDITEQKKLQQEYRQSKERFEIIFDKANCGIAYGDKQGNIIICNDYFAHMLKYTQEEIQTMHFAQFTHPDDSAVELPLFDEIVAQKRDGYRLQKRYICKDKSVIWVDLATSVVRDEAGQPINYLGVAIDITKEKQLEDDIKNKEKRFRDVTEASGEYIWELDSEGRYTFLSQPFEDMLGYSLQEGLHKTPFSFMPDDEAKRVGEYFTQEIASKGKKFTNLIHSSLTKDGATVWQKVNGLPMKDSDDNIIGYRGAALDITSEKIAEEELKKAKAKAEAANEAKTQFLANMSHEIRTPMNAVIGLGALLDDMIDSPKQKDILHKINSSSKMLLGVINDILDYSKIEAGKLELEYSTFGIEDLLLQLKVMFEEKASAKGLELYFYAKDQNIGLVLGDELRLTQVLTNLLSNAIKFTHEGNVILRIHTVHNQDNERIRLKFSIEDTGIGMNDVQMSKLFQSFSQADSSTTRKYGGTGLGLVISKNIIKAMGSDIQVKSEEGNGTTFWFELDFKLAACTIAHHTDNSMQKRALIVDDQSISVEILKTLLIDENYRCDEAYDGAQAIEKILQAQAANQSYDLLMVDWNMPNLNGIQMLHELQNMHNNNQITCKAPTIFMVSAYSKEEIDLDTVFVDSFISKPVTASVLKQAIVESQQHSTTINTLPNKTPSVNLSGIKALVVEDNVLNQEVVGMMLNKASITYDIAQDGKKGVEKFLAHPQAYDVILMDLQMPVMSGYEAAKIIRKHDKNIPIIALTAAAMVEDKQKVQQAGMNEHVSKPIDMTKLYEAIAHVCSVTLEPKASSTPQKSKAVLNTQQLLEIFDSQDKVDEVLLKFKDQLNSEFKDIAQIVQEKSANAPTQVHALKGLSGNVGAYELHDILVRIDAKYKSKSSVKAQEIDALKRAMQNVLSKLQSIQPTSKQMTESSTLDKKELHELFEQIKEHLKAGDFIDESLVQTLHDNLRHSLPAQTLNKHKALIDAFELDEAYALMKTWDI